MYNKVKVRFAPSPTGEMHIGNLRTAIFNWIFARKYNGKFYIRIEDTDKQRSTEEYKNEIFKILEKMNIDFDKFDEDIEGNDNGIITQSLRSAKYKKYAKKLFKKNMAFYCICEDNTNCDCQKHNHQEGVLRFKTPKSKMMYFKDLVFGDLALNTDALENFALLRSDGSPTYMLAVVVDDIEMNITHIIRGEDHKTNTFKQILIYEALEEKAPIFAHLPMIIGEDGKKMSKRNGNTSVKYYLDKGVIPDALFNILLKLGWGYGNEEIISKERILEIFNFKDVKSSSARFDERKLNSFSGIYLRGFDYTNYVNKFLKDNYNFEHEITTKLYSEIVKRSATVKEFYDQIKFIVDKENITNHMTKEEINLINNIKPKVKDKLLSDCREYCSDKNIDFKDFCKRLRLTITGKEFCPDIFEIIELLNINL